MKNIYVYSLVTFSLLNATSFSASLCAGHLDQTEIGEVTSFKLAKNKDALRGRVSREYSRNKRQLPSGNPQSREVAHKNMIRVWKSKLDPNGEEWKTANDFSQAFANKYKADLNFDVLLRATGLLNKKSISLHRIVKKFTKVWEKYQLQTTLVNVQRIKSAAVHETDFKGLHLALANLENLKRNNPDFSNANLYYAKLEGVRFSNAKFTSANMRGAIFDAAELDNVDMKSADLTHASLQGVDMNNADLTHATLKGADFSFSELNYAKFNSVSGECAIFSDVTAEKAEFTEANLRQTTAEGANFSSAIFSGPNTDISDSNWQGTDLSNSNLEGANLIRINLSNASLTNANFKKANLKKSNLQGARIEGANFDEANLLSIKTKKSRVKGSY